MTLDPLRDASGSIDGLPENCSEQFDEYLLETFVAKKPSTAAKLAGDVPPGTLISVSRCDRRPD